MDFEDIKDASARVQEPTPQMILQTLADASKRDEKPSIRDLIADPNVTVEQLLGIKEQSIKQRQQLTAYTGVDQSKQKKGPSGIEVQLAAGRDQKGNFGIVATENAKLLTAGKPVLSGITVPAPKDDVGYPDRVFRRQRGVDYQLIGDEFRKPYRSAVEHQLASIDKDEDLIDDRKLLPKKTKKVGGMTLADFGIVAEETTQDPNKGKFLHNSRYSSDHEGVKEAATALVNLKKSKKRKRPIEIHIHLHE